MKNNSYERLVAAMLLVTQITKNRPYSNFTFSFTEHPTSTYNKLFNNWNIKCEIQKSIYIQIFEWIKPAENMSLERCGHENN